MKLPAINELYSNTELALKNSELQTLLNQPPSLKWIKKHPIYSNDYIPVEVQEWLLTSIFGNWWVEVRNVTHMLNSAVVTVRVYVVDPISGKEMFQDGVGAHNFQLKAGAKADDFSQLQQNAVILAVPIAETRAFSDAVDKFGKIFGKDLNRKNSMSYDKISDKFKPKPELTPEHPEWNNAKMALDFNNTTIEQIKRNYTLSPENEALLCSK
jgi:hypothetical protein